MSIEVKIVDVKDKKRDWVQKIKITRNRYYEKTRTTHTIDVEYEAPDIANKGLNSYMLEDTIREMANIPDNAWCMCFEQTHKVDGTIIKKINFMVFKDHSHKKKREYHPGVEVRWYLEEGVING